MKPAAGGGGRTESSHAEDDISATSFIIRRGRCTGGAVFLQLANEKPRIIPSLCLFGVTERGGGGAKPLTLTLTLAVTTLSLNLTLTLRTKILTLDRTQILAQIWWLNYDQLLTRYRPNLTCLYPWGLKWTLRVKFLSNRRRSWTQDSGRCVPIVLAHFDWFLLKKNTAKVHISPQMPHYPYA